MVKLRHTHTKIKIILFCVLGAIIAAAGVAAIVIFTGNTHSPDEPTVTVNTKTAVPEGLTPAEAAQSSSQSANTLYYLAYTLDTQESYSVTAVNKSKSMGIESLTRTYKDYADGVMVATDITSGITKSAVQTCYVADENGTTVAYKRSGTGASKSATVSDISWNDTASQTYYYYRENYLTIYGEFSTEMTVYLVNDETIESYSEITGNGDGTYSQTFVFNDKAAWWYQYAMKTNGGLDDYPEFDKIEMTVTFDENWRVTQIVVEEDTVVEMVGTFSTSATTTTTFSYDESTINSENYSYYSSYFAEAMPYATAGGDTTVTASETSALTVLQSAFSGALNGGDQFALTLDTGGKTYYGYLYLNIDISASDILSNLDIRLALSADETCDSQDLYVEFKGGDVNAYYSSNLALTADINKISDAISQFTEWVNNYSYGTAGTDGAQAAKTKVAASDDADDSFSFGDLLGAIELTENTDGTANITLALDDIYGISAYVQIDVTVTESTNSSGTTTKSYTFKSAYIGDLSYEGSDVQLEINIAPTEAATITREESQTAFDLAEAISSVYALLNSTSMQVDISLDGEKIANLVNSYLDAEYSDYIALLSDYDITATAIVDIHGITTQANVKITSDTVTVIDLDVYYAYDGTSTYGIAYLTINNIMGVSCSAKACCNISDLADGITKIIDYAESLTGTVLGEETDGGTVVAGISLTAEEEEDDGTAETIIAIINAVLGIDFGNSLTVSAQNTSISVTLNADNLVNDIIASMLGTSGLTLDLGIGEIALAYSYSTDESGNVLAGTLDLEANSLGIGLEVSGSSTAVKVPEDADTYLDFTGAVNSVYELLASDTLQLELNVYGSAIVDLVNGLTDSSYSDYLSILNDYNITISALADIDGTVQASILIAGGDITVIDADVYYLFDGIYSGASQYGTVYLAVNAFMGVQCTVKLTCGIDQIIDSVNYIQYIVTGEEAEDQQEEDGSSLSVLDIITTVLSLDYTAIIDSFTIDNTDGIKVSVDIDGIIALFLEDIALNLGSADLGYSYTTDGAGNVLSGELTLAVGYIISAVITGSDTAVTEPDGEYLSLNNLMTSVENAVKVAMDIAQSGATFEISGAVKVNDTEISADGSGEVVLETSTATNAGGEEVTTTALKSVAVDVTLTAANGIYGKDSESPAKVSLQIVYIADNFKAAEEGEEETPFLYIVIDGKGMAVTYSQFAQFTAEMTSVYEVISGLISTLTTDSSNSGNSGSDGSDTGASLASTSVSVADEDLLTILQSITGLLAESGIISEISKLADMLNNFAVTADEDGNISLTYTYGEGEEAVFNIAYITTTDGKLTLASDIADLSSSLSAYDSAAGSIADSLVTAFADTENYDLTYNVSGMAGLLYSYVFECIDSIDINSLFGSAAYELALVLDGDASGISALEGVYVEVTATAGATSDSKNIYTIDANMDIGGFTVDISMAYYSGYIYININDIGGTQFTDLAVKAATYDIYSLIESAVKLILSEDVLNLVSSLIPEEDGTETTAAQAALLALTSDGEAQEETSSTLTAVLEMLASLIDGTLLTIDLDGDQLVLVDIDGILAPFGITAGAGTFTVDKIYTADEQTGDSTVTGIKAAMTSGESEWLTLSANGTGAAKYTAVSAESAAEEDDGTFYTGDYIDISFVSQLVQDVAKFAISGIQTDSEGITGVEYTFTTDEISIDLDLSSISSALQSLTNIAVTIKNVVITMGYGEDGICVSFEGDLQEKTVIWEITKGMHIGLTYYNGYITLQRESSGVYIYKIMTLDYFMENMLTDDSPLYWWLGMSQSLWSMVVGAINSSSSGTVSELYLYNNSSSDDSGTQEEATPFSLSDYITCLLVSLTDTSASYGSDDGFTSWLTDTANLTANYYALSLNASGFTDGILNSLYVAITHDDSNGIGDIWAYMDVYSYVKATISLTYSPDAEAATNQYIAADGDAAIANYTPSAGTGYENSFGLYNSESDTYDSVKTYDTVVVTIVDIDGNVSYETLDYGSIVYMNDYYVYDNDTTDDTSDDYYIIYMYDYNENAYAGASVTLTSNCMEKASDGYWYITFYAEKVSTSETVNVATSYVTYTYDAAESYTTETGVINAEGTEYTLYSEVTDPDTKEGYTFAGWYYDEECTQAVGAVYDRDGTGSVTVYAKYVQTEVTINGVTYKFAAADSLSYSSGTESGSYSNTVTVEGGYYVVTGYTDDLSAYYTADSWLVLENEVMGYKVLEIGAAAFDSASLKNVVIPENIVLIGARAFLDNNDMETVVFLADYVYMADDYEESTYSNITSNESQASKMFAFYGCSVSSSETSSILNIYYNTIYSSGYTTAGGNDTNVFCFRVTGNSITGYKYYLLDDNTHADGTWLWITDSSYIAIPAVDGLELESDDLTGTVQQAFLTYLAENGKVYYNFTESTDGITALFIGASWTDIDGYSGLAEAIAQAVESEIDAYTAENEGYIHAYAASAEVDDIIRVVITGTDSAYYAAEINAYDENSAEYTFSSITFTSEGTAVYELLNGSYYIPEGTVTVTVTPKGSYKLTSATYGGTAYSGEDITEADGVYSFTVNYAGTDGAITLNWEKYEEITITIYSEVSFTYGGNAAIPDAQEAANCYTLGATAAKAGATDGTLGTLSAEDGNYYFLGYAMESGGSLAFTTISTSVFDEQGETVYYAVWGDSTVANATLTSGSEDSNAFEGYLLAAEGYTFYGWWYYANESWAQVTSLASLSVNNSLIVEALWISDLSVSTTVTGSSGLLTKTYSVTTTISGGVLSGAFADSATVSVYYAYCPKNNTDLLTYGNSEIVATNVYDYYVASNSTSAKASSNGSKSYMHTYVMVTYTYGETTFSTELADYISI